MRAIQQGIQYLGGASKCALLTGHTLPSVSRPSITLRPLALPSPVHVGLLTVALRNLLRLSVARLHDLKPCLLLLP